jgi:hypothetical protein
MAFTSRDWFFALKVALAALLAMGIAFWADLPRPYWAVTSVYMVSQPLTGATTSKAAYRLYGTILGAIAGGIDDRERSSGSNLLANVNPTFSWVRLAQRIPVRIALDPRSKSIDLVAGRTATVEIRPGSSGPPK